MTKELSCFACSKPMASIRDASIRRGMIVYCGPCNDKIQRLPKAAEPAANDMPDFLREVFGGRI